MNSLSVHRPVLGKPDLLIWGFYSSISPILRNIYISVVSYTLEVANVPHFIHVNDIVIFNSHKDSKFAIDLFNNSLDIK